MGPAPVEMSRLVHWLRMQKAILCVVSVSFCASVWGVLANRTDPRSVTSDSGAKMAA